ncbi:hypothetical protein MmazTMA_35570 [Methanosarcina mazei]|jgi:peptide methionine sulfoxide reductase MsrA|nr:hypothetical protein MmazTMA_35570 [Methanosarcina mazei]
MNLTINKNIEKFYPARDEKNKKYNKNPYGRHYISKKRKE